MLTLQSSFFTNTKISSDYVERGFVPIYLLLLWASLGALVVLKIFEVGLSFL
jgi:hypothetical protein